MYRLSSDSKYRSNKTLQELSLNRPSALSKPTHTHLRENTLEYYQKENQELKIRCKKIEEIEQYANILVTEIENFKVTNAELQRRNSELNRSNEILAIELSSLKNRTFQTEDMFAASLSNKPLKQKQLHEDGLHSIRAIQQIKIQRQRHERAITALQSKHKSQLFEVERHIKSLETKYSQEKLILKKEVQSLRIENKELKNVVSQLRLSVQKLQTEDEKMLMELKRCKSVNKEVQEQVKLKANAISKLETESYKSIQQLDRQLNAAKSELAQKLQTISLLEKINSQLKQQGAVLIAQGDQMKENILQLEQVKYSQMRRIEQLENQLTLHKSTQELRQHQLKEGETKYKQLISALERDNIQLREQNNQLLRDNLTKQAEIHDLIQIVNTLELQLQEVSLSTTKLIEDNAALNRRLRESESKVKQFSEELGILRKKSDENAKYASQTEKNYVQTKTRLVELELIYQKEKGRVIELDKQLQKEIQKKKDIQQQMQHIIAKAKERQELLANSQQCINQCQRLYILQRQSHKASKEIIFELQTGIDHLKTNFQSEKKQLQQQFQLQKHQLMEQGIQAVQKLMAERYEKILKQKSEHFATKIKYLQSEVELLSKQEQYNKFD